jgi:hypothetical protein
MCETDNYGSCQGDEMNKSNVLEELALRTITVDDLAEKVRRDFSLLPQMFEGISSTNPRVRFGCAKILRSISEEKPEKLYPRIDFFVKLLDNDNKIIKWNAMDALANLTRVDRENKFDQIFTRYFGFLFDETMITAGHVIGNSGKIARAKPYLTQRITDELLKIESIRPKGHLTQECKNILLGDAILAFATYFDQIENRGDVVSFAKRQLHNTRNATKKKAEAFLKKFA